jgi:hypothetical protein
MRYNQPLKQILTSARNLWDRDETRPAVRENFNKVALCRTPALGAERYASETEEKLVYHKRVETRYSITEFVATLADHVPDRYCHAIRYFGLLAPSSKRKTSAALFALLGQAQRHRPQRLSWAYSLQKHFGFDPLNCALSLRGSWKANGGLPVKSDSSPHACLAIN